MKDQQIHNEALFRDLFKDSSLQVPFSDLEEGVMQRIKAETAPVKIVSVDRKLSFFFFITGTLLGLVLNSFLQKLQTDLPKIPWGILILLFQLFFALFFLVKLESFLKLTVRIKRAN